MAKRFADKELTHDNWDQEQEGEEAGVFRIASKEVLEKREIKKAKRRGVTDETGGAGAFKGFSFGSTTTAAGSLDSKPFSFSMQPNSTTSESTSKPAFGGYSVAAPTVTSMAAPVSVAPVVSKSGSPKTSGDSDTESQYRHRLRTLNESVLRWIDDHIKTSPYCILTPVFNDYEKYIKELDRDFPQSSDKVVGKTPVATTAAAGFSFASSSVGASSTVSSSAVSNSQTSTSATVVAGLFSAGTTAANSDGKLFAPPTSTTAVTTGVSASGLTCGTLPSIGATSSGLNLGAQSSKEATFPASGFSFGAQLLKGATKTSGFSFGAQTSKEPSTSLAAKDANSPLSGFSFGAQPSKELATSLPAKDANSPISGFSFGQPSKEATKTPGFIFGAPPSTELASKEANPPISGFNFGAQQSKEATAAPESGFRFSFQQNKEATSSSTPAVASTSAGGEDDNYVPPKAEVVDIKEDDAFYTIRCKLYYQINNEYKDRGIGNLYLKPCGEKTQLLVRAGTTLGNILLNIMLNENIKTNRQGANVTMYCVPNPPLDEKKPNDKTPVMMVLRVKTEEDAETLLKQIDDHK